MPYLLDCPCGHCIQLPDNNADEHIRCPVCLAVLPIPSHYRPVVAAADRFEVETLLSCPTCHRQWSKETVLCVECGHDFRTGKKLKRAFQPRDETIAIGWTWLGCFFRFTVRRNRKGKLSLIRRPYFFWLPLWSSVIELKNYDSVVTDYEFVSYYDGQFRHQYDQFYLELQGRGKPYQIWHGRTESHMHALIDFLRETAGLTVKRN